MKLQKIEYFRMICYFIERKGLYLPLINWLVLKQSGFFDELSTKLRDPTRCQSISIVFRGSTPGINHRV